MMVSNICFVAYDGRQLADERYTRLMNASVFTIF